MSTGEGLSGPSTAFWWASPHPACPLPPHLPGWPVGVCQPPFSCHGCAPHPGCRTFLTLGARWPEKRRYCAAPSRWGDPGAIWAQRYGHATVRESPFWSDTVRGAPPENLSRCTSTRTSSCQTRSGPAPRRKQAAAPASAPALLPVAGKAAQRSWGRGPGLLCPRAYTPGTCGNFFTSELLFSWKTRGGRLLSAPASGGGRGTAGLQERRPGRGKAGWGGRRHPAALPLPAPPGPAAAAAGRCSLSRPPAQSHGRPVR